MLYYMHNRHAGFGLLTAAAFVCSAALMYWVTAQGPGVSPDSVTYIEAARSLLAGRGFTLDGQAITHYPPLYPLLIAAVDWLLHLGNTIQAARLVAVLFYGTNVVLVGLAVYLCTNWSIAAASCAMLAFLSSAHMLFVHAMAWSEAPFIAFCISNLLLLSLHIIKPRPLLLIWAGIMAGLAVFARYIGIVLFPTAFLAFFLLDKRTIKLRLQGASIFSAVAGFPFILWIVRNMLSGNSATNRKLIFHPVGMEHFKMFLDTIKKIIISFEIRYYLDVLYAVFFIALLLYFLILSLKRRKRDYAVFVKNYLLFAAVYVALVFVSISFFDAATPLDERILSPSLVVFIILIFTSILGEDIEVKKTRPPDRLFLVSILFILTNMIPFIATAINIHQNGIGYCSRYWNNNIFIKHISSHPENRIIYSNGNDIIRFLSKKQALMIPAKFASGTMQLNKDYQENMNKMIRECIKGESIIVYLHSFEWRWYLPSREEIESSGNLPVLIRTEDGVIYGK